MEMDEIMIGLFSYSYASVSIQHPLLFFSIVSHNFVGSNSVLHILN